MSTDQAPPSPPAKRSSWAKAADWGLVILLTAFVISQIVIWTLWNPTVGDSLKNLITASECLLVTVCLIAWWFLYAPVSRRTMLIIGIPVLLLIGGWVASIRSVEFTGDMVLRFHYRWEPTAEERLASHLSSLEKVSLDTLMARKVPELQPEDMPAYRGQNRDGVVIGPTIKQDWQTDAPKELWRHPVGGGYASMAIVGDFLVTLEQREDDEAIVCYDAPTGQELWEHRYPADFFEAMGGAGPRSTPTIDGDAVYSLGAFGDLCCLDLLTGKLRWHVNALQQFHVANTDWGISCSPLVHEGKVIINIGGQSGNGLIAYGTDDGSLVWHTAGISPAEGVSNANATGEAAVPTDLKKKSVPGYASPQLSTVAGELLILNLDGLALRGHDPQTGKELWSVPFSNGPHVNVAQPVVFEDGRIFLSASYDVGAKMVQVRKDNDQWEIDDLWENLNMRCKFTSPVLFEGFLYGIDEGIFVCVDPESGKRKWKGGRSGLRGRYGHGQILLTNGQILAQTEQGEAVLINPSPDQLEEVAVMRVLPKGKNWNPLVLCRGKLYVRNAEEMACYDLQATTDKPSELASTSGH